MVMMVNSFVFIQLPISAATEKNAESVESSERESDLCNISDYFPQMSQVKALLAFDQILSS